MRAALWALALFPVLGFAEPDSHAAIADQRQTLERAFEAQMKACRTRFAVSDCVDEARRLHRVALKPLRERELRLDDAERQRRAEERRQSLDAKAREAARRPVAAPPTDTRLRQPPAASGPGRGRPAASDAPLPASDAATLDAERSRAAREAAAGAAARSREHAREQSTERARAADEARARVDAAAERARAAAEVRARVVRKQAEREAKGKSAPPLPVPAASAIDALR